MKIETVLHSLGLQKHEITLYLALLELGNATIADLTRHTHLHRPMVYTWLDSLIEKNLAAFSFKGKRKIYFAESPKKLESLIRDLSTGLTDSLPELIGKYEKHEAQKPKIKFFEGKRMITLVYEDVLNTCKRGDVFYRYESPKAFLIQDAILPPAYFERICKNKEIQKFIITNEKTLKTKKPVPERKAKAVPASIDIFDYDITQIIYNNKVAFLDLAASTAWVIESERFAHFQERLFRLLFEKL